MAKLPLPDPLRSEVPRFCRLSVTIGLFVLMTLMVAGEAVVPPLYGPRHNSPMPIERFWEWGAFVALLSLGIGLLFAPGMLRLDIAVGRKGKALGWSGYLLQPFAGWRSLSAFYQQPELARMDIVRSVVLVALMVLAVVPPAFFPISDWFALYTVFFIWGTLTTGYFLPLILWYCRLPG